jgi:hypothetical protein
MSYFTQNIPNSGDDPKVSQGQLLGNFGKINEDYAIDHVGLTASSDNGFHKRIVFENVLGVDPNFAANICSLYTKTVSGNPELFFQNDNTAVDIFQLTNLTVTNTGTNYSVTTPWGIKFQFGQSATSPITFNSPFSVGFTKFSAILTGIAATNPKVATFTDTGITYSPSNSVYYFAAGTP